MIAHRAYIGLGANLGDPRATLHGAARAIHRLPGMKIVSASLLWRSAPIEAHGPDFVNAVVAVDTTLDPQALLDALHAIEGAHGRERPYRNAPRTLDLDLLLYEDRVIDAPTLTLPHPRMHLRRFVLGPLAQIDGEALVPGHGSVRQLLEHVGDQDATPTRERLRFD